ncbi:hypothetical protein VYU27_005058 [Nannochloropsis oceanica]
MGVKFLRMGKEMRGGRKEYQVGEEVSRNRILNWCSSRSRRRRRGSSSSSSSSSMCWNEGGQVLSSIGSVTQYR